MLSAVNSFRYFGEELSPESKKALPGGRGIDANILMVK
jgi:hypothetical protein